MRHAIIYALVFTAAPFHVGNAAAMAVPWVERNYGWWVVVAGALLYLWGLVTDAVQAHKVDPGVRRRLLFFRWYVQPLAVLTVLHLVAVAATDCGRQWDALLAASGPPAQRPEVRPGGIPPPPGRPTAAVRPVLAAVADLVATLVRAAAVFLYRTWATTPWVLFGVGLVVSWLRQPVERK